MMLRFFCLVFLLSATVVFGEEAVLDNEVRQLVKKLGDKSYVVRQRAEAQLLRIGVGAYTKLQRAKKDKDVEIARRAEEILAQFEMIFIGQENGVLSFWIKQYAFETNVVEKAGIIWLLASPFYDAPDGEGLPTLCRIVRFDSEYALRAEAAKCLIAIPPSAPSKKRKWFRTIRETFADPGDDNLLQLVAEFARLYCDLDDLKDAAEKKAKDDAERTGIPIDYPVPLNSGKTLQNRVLRLTDRIAEFQSKPENSSVQAGNWVDIMLFYGLAEIQDLAGLTAERDRAVAAAQAVRTESLGETHPLCIINEEVKQPFYDHYTVGRILKMRYRLYWATPHYKLVNDESGITLRLKAFIDIAETANYLQDYAEAVRQYDRCLQIVGSDAYKNTRNNSEEVLRTITASKMLNLATETANKEDWGKTLELVKQGLEKNPLEFDLLILAHRLGTGLIEVDQNFRYSVKRNIHEAFADIARKINRSEVDPDRRAVYVANLYNQAAWLLSGTDGDYRSALTMIETALKSEPEECGWLDTLGHVYFLGKEYGKAVEAQENAVRLAPEAAVFRTALTKFRNAAKQQNQSENNQ